MTDTKHTFEATDWYTTRAATAELIATARLEVRTTETLLWDADGRWIGSVPRSMGDVLAAILKELAAARDEDGEELIDEYFSQNGELRDSDPYPANGKRLCVYAVTGGSEGWYVHVEYLEAITLGGGAGEIVVRDLWLGKSLHGGLAQAYRACAVIARVLGA